MKDDINNPNINDNASEFWIWAEKNVSASIFRKMHQSYGFLNMMLRQKKLISVPFFNLSTEEEISDLATQIRQNVANKVLRNDGLRLLSYFSNYLRSKESVVMPNAYFEQDRIGEEVPSIVCYNFQNDSDFERTLPYRICINNVSFEGRNWVQIYIGLIEFELKNHSSLLEPLYLGGFTSKNKGKPFFMSKKIEGLHCIQLSNGFWVNVNYSIPRLVYLIGELSCYLGYDRNNYKIRIYPNGLFTQKEETIFVKRKGLIVDDDL